ncbi:MAG: YkgJ family cysteine cluster protein [Candidatus Dormibacteraeota bacterium]|nr:YkgJ family cysteine cluster protein [Candidatus Dormibacteraeota bacterium]
MMERLARPPVGPEFGGCADCNGRCCQYLVPLTCSDVQVVSRALALAPEQFVTLLPQAEEEPAGIRLSAGEPPFTMVLEQREPINEQPRCIFLLELPDGTARCGVYAHRPRLCRTFPASLQQGGVAVRSEIPCSAGSWNLARMDLPWWRTELIRSEMEQAFHEIVVARWNATLGGADATPSDFFRFATAACDRLETMVASTGEDLRRSVLDWSRDQPERSWDTAPAWVEFLQEAAQVVRTAG